MTGQGTAPDAAEAAAWYRKAAEQGETDGMRNYALCLLRGDGIPADAAQAALWLQRAAERNDPEARALLQQLRKGRE